MHYIYLFLFSFCLVYIIYYLFIVMRKKSLEKLRKSKSMDYFKQLYKIDPKKVDIKKFANHFGMANAFIISFVITVIEFFDSMIIKLLVALLLIIPVIYFTYGILGKHYQNKVKGVKK